MGKRIFHSEDPLNDLLENTEQVRGCALWTRALDTDGYPRMGGNVKVHRLVHLLLTGDEPEVVRHTCDNPRCIHPQHLVGGTFTDNGHDKFLRDRQPRVVSKETVFKCIELLKGDAKQVNIANELGIDPRRVSDIKCGKYCSATGKFLGHGIRRI